MWLEQTHQILLFSYIGPKGCNNNPVPGPGSTRGGRHNSPGCHRANYPSSYGIVEGSGVLLSDGATTPSLPVVCGWTPTVYECGVDWGAAVAANLVGVKEAALPKTRNLGPNEYLPFGGYQTLGERLEALDLLPKLYGTTASGRIYNTNTSMIISGPLTSSAAISLVISSLRGAPTLHSGLCDTCNSESGELYPNPIGFISQAKSSVGSSIFYKGTTFGVVTRLLTYEYYTGVAGDLCRPALASGGTWLNVNATCHAVDAIMRLRFARNDGSSNLMLFYEGNGVDGALELEVLVAYIPKEGGAVLFHHRELRWIRDAGSLFTPPSSEGVRSAYSTIHTATSWTPEYGALPKNLAAVTQLRVHIETQLVHLAAGLGAQPRFRVGVVVKGGEVPGWLFVLCAAATIGVVFTWFLSKTDAGIALSPYLVGPWEVVCSTASRKSNMCSTLGYRDVRARMVTIGGGSHQAIALRDGAVSTMDVSYDPVLILTERTRGWSQCPTLPYRRDLTSEPAPIRVNLVWGDACVQYLRGGPHCTVLSTVSHSSQGVLGRKRDERMMQPQQPIVVMNTNTERETGRKAQISNITAAKTVADVIRTCLGPRSMLKMLLDPMGGIVLTNDGNAILREVEVAHPAAKSRIELSRTQDERG
ncbi:hypothetical protein BJ684DRAFT_15836, partial [Piptocephalis cylindrospora]